MLRLRTVKLLARLIKPWTEEGVITVSEEQEIISNLRHLASKGHMLPDIKPKLIDQREAADLLGLGYSNFRKMLMMNELPFKKKRLGSSRAVRFLNLDIYKFMLGTTDFEQEVGEHNE